jgi:hypothetical protein
MAATIGYVSGALVAIALIAWFAFVAYTWQTNDYRLREGCQSRGGIYQSAMGNCAWSSEGAGQ